MHFLPDVYVPCDVCKGKRYNRETLEVKYKGKNIHEILEMTVEDARAFFDPVPAVARKLQTLMDVGLSYIRLGQSATTLSGGEAQRVKLARELSKRDTGQTLYILDEPTTGLHFHDIQQLLKVLHQLRDQATPSSSSSTTWTSSKPRTGSLIWARKGALVVAVFW
jgi:excinuclease ABC subunit A